MSFRERLARFMVGRNGVDELAQAELLLVMVLLVASMFIRVLSLPAILLMVHTYYRMFSRNTSRRYAENQWWRNFRYRMAVKWNSVRKRWNERGLYRYYKCPKCKQKVRVPSGHGRICITCPKCRGEFVRRS